MRKILESKKSHWVHFMASQKAKIDPANSRKSVDYNNSWSQQNMDQTFLVILFEVKTEIMLIK